jgi:hypothetical protein
LAGLLASCVISLRGTTAELPVLAAGVCREVNLVLGSSVPVVLRSLKPLAPLGARLTLLPLAAPTGGEP